MLKSFNQGGQGKMIEGVVFRPIDPAWSNRDERRDMITVFDGDADLGEFSARQFKIMLMKINCFLGNAGHYHIYSELYFVEEGEVTFDLREENGAPERYVIVPGWFLVIPAGVRHRAYAKANTRLLGFTEQPYRKGSDIPDFFDPAGPLPYGLTL